MNEEDVIEGLARQVRALKRLVYSMCGLFGLGVLLAATSLNGVDEIVSAKMFAVEDDEGNMVLSLGSDGNGGSMYLYDKKGMQVFRVSSADVYGGVMSLYTKDEKTMLKFDATDAFGGKMSVYNNEGKVVASLNAGANGRTGWGGLLSVRNKDGAEVATMRSDQESNGVVATSNDKGKGTGKLP